MNEFVPLFLAITFAIHGSAFTFLGLKRGKSHYFLLTGTFTFLTVIYLMKFEGWAVGIPGTTASAAPVLRVGAALCTLSYLRLIYSEEGSWLWKIRRRLRNR